MPPTTREIIVAATGRIDRAIAELMRLQALAGLRSADLRALGRRVGELRAEIDRAAAVAAMAAASELRG